MRRRSVMHALALCALVACGASSSGDPEPTAPTTRSPVAAEALNEVRGEALGTTWMVKWVGDPGTDVRPVIEGVLARVDQQMSTWRDDSELSAIRAAEGPVTVSEETAFVVREALVLAEATDGAFDPTVQPLMELWGLHGAKREAPPTADEVAGALEQVGWRKVGLGRDPAGAPTVDSGGTALDLSAIAKGHAVDRISEALSALHLPDHLVEVGGEVRAMGNGPKGPWRLGVDRPEQGLAPGEKLAAIATLTNVAMATSGNYRNAYEVDGVKVVHTLDPRQGRPALGSVASATVVAPDCRTADGWATALMVLGEEGLSLVEARPGVEAYLLLVDGEGFKARATTGMAPWITE